MAVTIAMNTETKEALLNALETAATVIDYVALEDPTGLIVYYKPITWEAAAGTAEAGKLTTSAPIDFTNPTGSNLTISLAYVISSRSFGTMTDGADWPTGTGSIDSNDNGIVSGTIGITLAPGETLRISTMSLSIAAVV